MNRRVSGETTLDALQREHAKYSRTSKLVFIVAAVHERGHEMGRAPVTLRRVKGSGLFCNADRVDIHAFGLHLPVMYESVPLRLICPDTGEIIRRGDRCMLDAPFFPGISTLSIDPGDLKLNLGR
jgi:hypothetical protein